MACQASELPQISKPCHELRTHKNKHKDYSANNTQRRGNNKNPRHEYVERSQNRGG